MPLVEQRLTNLEAAEFRHHNDLELLQSRYEEQRSHLTDGLDTISGDLRETRQDVAEILIATAATDERLDRIETDVAELKADVGDLKTELAQVKGLVELILRRLPEPADS